MELLLTALIIIGIIIGVAAILLVAYLAFPIERPLPTESDYSHHRFPSWQLYYGHKYARVIHKPERNKGLEDRFANTDLCFNQSADQIPLQNIQTLTLAGTGDLMFRRDLVGNSGKHLWDEVGADVFGADLSIGNLEFAVNPHENWEKLLRFSVPENMAMPLLEAARFGKMDVVSLANNHINDSRKGGITYTCDFLDRIGVRHTGANRTAEEQSQVTIIEQGPFRIAVLGYTFSTNNIPLEEDFTFGTNLVRFNALNDADYDPSTIHAHIKTAKEQGANYIVACNHWCIDMEHYPPSRIVKRANDLIDAGVDLILGHHPHVIGPFEKHVSPDGREGIICYSLGNITGRGLFFPVQRLSQLAQITLEAGETAEGRTIVRPRQIKAIPMYHSQRRVLGLPFTKVVDNRIWPLSAQRTNPGALTFKEKLFMKKLQRRFHKIVGKQKGIVTD